MSPPSLQPITSTRRTWSVSSSATMSSAMSWYVSGPGRSVLRPWARASGTISRWLLENSGRCFSNCIPFPAPP
jgi:hypothetical protein